MTPDSTTSYTLAEMLALYHHVTVIMRNNHLSSFDPAVNRYSLGYVDHASNGRPEFSQATATNPNDLYWSLNQTFLSVRAQNDDSGTMTLALKTNTPDFQRFEVRLGAKNGWTEVSPIVDWTLAEGESALEARH